MNIKINLITQSSTLPRPRINETEQRAQENSNTFYINSSVNIATHVEKRSFLQQMFTLDIHMQKREIRNLLCRIYLKKEPKIYSIQISVLKLQNQQEKHKRDFLATVLEMTEIQASKATVEQWNCTKPRLYTTNKRVNRAKK